MKLENLLFGAILISSLSQTLGHSCIKIPLNKNKVNSDRYVIEISGNPKGYTPGENYTITLKLNPGLSEIRFSEFTLAAEPMTPLEGASAGKFTLINNVLAAFNADCPQTVIQASYVAKTSVEVLWMAPPADSGCVVLKAIVVDTSNNWFSDGDLTKLLCEEDGDNEDRLPKILEQCSACDEAKYEVAFQGLWSRNTHPNHFPADMWSTKLGGIIGASHKYEKSFWQQGKFASPGLKLLAEEGDTSELETELKEMVKNDEIRTIIKARELAHPKITGTSYTVVRVDNENHLISLVSKIIPSPDWIVGLSNLDLCLENGSWAMSYTFNLYPWDVGTDDGLSYDSLNSPSMPPQLIRPIKSNSPNTDESPFYDPDGRQVKPLAKLHLTRQKLYEKECNLVATTKVFNSEKCETGDWGEWSNCSATCGKGHRTRTRELTNPEHERICTRYNPLLLEDTEECEEEACEEGGTNLENDCPNTVWQPWSKCSVTCGTGIQERYRSRISEEDAEEENEDNEEEEQEGCSQYKETVECYQPPCATTFGSDLRTENIRIVAEGPSRPVIDCKVTKWSVWSPCDTSLPCKKRYKFKVRTILIHPQNGGRPCPRKLQKKKKCKCSKEFVVEAIPDQESVDCVMGPWSRWSPCSTTCGYAVRQRTRSILRYPKGNGKPCEHRKEEKQCPLPLACTDNSFPYY